MNYQNFDLEIISPQEGGRFCARVLESPQGGCPFAELQWPFQAEEENELLSEIYGGPRQRRARSGRTTTIQDFGGKLFDTVFAGDIERLYRASLDSALREGKGLRIRLLFPEERDLHSRPWEYLFDTESREFLAVREHTPLVRYLPGAQVLAPVTVEGPLRILVALSAPTDHPRLDIAREWEILCHALELPITAGLIELHRVPGRCTFDNLRDSLRHFGAHIFHFVGHGMPGAIVLEQESGKGLEMEATHLRYAFPSGALPRLIVLNACSGALSEDVPFSGLPQVFLKQGVPAVVAMQTSITDDAALIFTRYFYRDLVETGAVDASLTEARLRMKGNGHPIEWGTPVLYMRALSGQIFQPVSLQKTLWEAPQRELTAAPPRPALQPEQDDEKTLLEASRRMANPPPRVEPTLKEELDPWYAQWSAFLPPVEQEPRRGRQLPLPLLAVGLPVLLVLVGFAAYEIFFANDTRHAPTPTASMPAPTPTVKPAPAPTPAILPQTETSRAESRPENQARPIPAPTTSGTGKSAKSAASHAQAGRKAAPPKAAPPKAAPPKPADNCANPDVNERSAECVFR